MIITMIIIIIMIIIITIMIIIMSFPLHGGIGSFSWARSPLSWVAPEKLTIVTYSLQ